MKFKKLKTHSQNKHFPLNERQKLKKKKCPVSEIQMISEIFHYSYFNISDEYFNVKAYRRIYDLLINVFGKRFKKKKIKKYMKYYK